MFGKDKYFAFEKTGPDLFWTGQGWRVDRRKARDPRLGRRRSDAHFPYASGFVVQSLAGENEGVSRDIRTGDRNSGYKVSLDAGFGRYLTLKI